MSGIDIALAMQLVLQAACPEANVVFGIPKMFHDPALIYFWEDNSDDIMKTTGTVRRHHSMQVHLLVQSSGDDQEAELLTYALRDRIKSAFQVNHRLMGTAANSTLTNKTLGSQYLLMGDAGSMVEYRATGFVWDVEEQLTFVFA